MADVPYTRSFSFAGFQANQPAKPLPGQRVDIEFDNIAREFGALRALIAAGGGSGGGGTPGVPGELLPLPARSLRANLLSSTSAPQVVSFDQFKTELGLGSGGGALPDWNDVQNKPVFGNAALRNVGASAGTVAAGDDPRLVGALQSAQNGNDIPNKALFRSNLGLKGAALLDVGTAAGTVAAGDAVAGKVDRADPQMAAPPFVTFPAPSIVTSVPQRAIDQDGVLHLGHLGADLTGVGFASVIMQKSLDAIATRIANGIAVSTDDGKRLGGVLHIPTGATLRINQGLTFSADGPISVIGGSGKNRNAVRFLQECDTLFDFTADATLEANGASSMLVELGGLFVNGKFADCQPFRVRGVEALHAHDLRYSSGLGFSARCFMNLRNLRTSQIERMYLRNDNGGGLPETKGSCFNMTATKGSTDNHFIDIAIQGYQTGFNMVSSAAPGIEGTHMDSCRIFGCVSGIIWSAAGATYTSGSNAGQKYIPPLLHFMNGHMNCQREWVVASQIADLKIGFSQLELHNEFGYTNSPGIALTDVERFDISHNFLGMDRQQSLIVTAGGCNLGTISANKGIAFGTTAPAIQIINPSRNIDVLDNCFAMNAGNTVWAGDAANNNTNINNRKAI